MADCHFVATAKGAQGAVDMMMAHASDDHKDKIEAMSKTMTMNQIMEMMLSKVKQT